MVSRIIACVALAGMAGSAQAAFFSFASDSRDTAWTFSGSGANLVDSTAPTDPLTLLIDDNNGALPTLSVAVQFNALITIAWVADVPLPGGAFSHNYSAAGTFSFINVASGTPLLTVNFTNCLVTTRGGAASWFSTAALQGDDAGGATVGMTWSGASLPGYGLAPGALLATPRGFAFDMSALNTSGAIPYNGQNPGVGLNASHLPSATWFSEASFSGSGSVVPAPGGAAVLGLAGLAAMRRRRR